jgi:hypothetical protein
MIKRGVKNLLSAEAYGNSITGLINLSYKCHSYPNFYCYLSFVVCLHKQESWVYLLMTSRGRFLNGTGELIIIIIHRTYMPSITTPQNVHSPPSLHQEKMPFRNNLRLCSPFIPIQKPAKVIL